MNVTDDGSNGLPPRSCFSLVQSRRFNSPVATSTVALCPSMDLLTLALQQPPQQQQQASTSLQQKASISPLWLHRSLSFQKLATVVVSNNDNEEDNNNDDNEQDKDSSIPTDASSKSAAISAVWRPDGRWLAVADGKERLTLYHIEALVKETTLTPSSLFSSAPASSSFLGSLPNSFQVTMSGNVVRIPFGTSSNTPSTTVCGLIWSHVGQWHPKLAELAGAGNHSDDSDDEDADNCTNVPHLYAKIRQRYADRTAPLLPASGYHSEHAAAVPSSQTPLSVLVLAKTNGTLDWFLNGRYRIASDVSFFTPTPSCARAQIACSNDLSNFLVVAQKDTNNRTQGEAAATSSYFSLLTLPALAEQRYTLQSLTALYSSIMGHFDALPSLLTEVLESYKSSLKPLDTKLEGLARLLRNYDLLPQTDVSAKTTATAMRQHLVRYILSGHTAGSADLSNAMDQFFTGVQMNDQLIQRMERSLTVAVANVETSLRKSMAAAQALVCESDELRGLSRSSNELIPSEPAMELQERCNALMIAMESSLTSLVDARFRFRDFIAWLRATGSQIKARGTAPNSVQRDNAKKRRVPDDTVRRILRYLQDEKDGEKTTTDATSASGSLCESLLGIRLSQHWETASQHVSSEKPHRPGSPQSVVTSSSFGTPPSIPSAFQQASAAAKTLFDGPAEGLKRCIRRYDLELPVSPIMNATAITTRLGAGGLNGEGLVYGESPPDGFFKPRILNDEDVLRAHRQWGLCAQTTEHNVVQIWAFPLSWHTFSALHLWNDPEKESYDHDMFLQATLQFPSGYRVHELSFYGDDGKSALFSGAENGTGMERRQALAALVSRDITEEEEDTTVSVMELWLIRYEQACWQRGDLLQQDEESDVGKLSFAPIPGASPTLVEALVGEEDEEEDEMEDDGSARLLSCKTRRLDDFASDGDSACLELSGSRGIAAVTTKNGTFLQILDMEEDEETEEMEED